MTVLAAVIQREPGQVAEAVGCAVGRALINTGRGSSALVMTLLLFSFTPTAERPAIWDNCPSCSRGGADMSRGARGPFRGERAAHLYQRMARPCRKRFISVWLRSLRQRMARPCRKRFI